ncbi:hypothetical protein BaRGS_00003903 [Batillaria attramentaria]|uniref:Uncharacterized protein n=1 Tax=Batillaria attramentaria TaxID=370345 RepID=A0ABD0LZ49_9CAEN|nr:hypothetical protein BaRGS_023975 [Batillaria attramentaria]
MFAQEEGTRDQLVHILLEGGADVNMTDKEGRSPLIHACEKRCNDIVRILIHHHNIKPDLEDVYGNTALIYSAAVGNDVATELLTRNFRRLGLQVDHYNKQGNTALLVAARNGNLNCAKILAQKGRASVQLKDKEHNMTSLEWCLKEGYQKEEVEFLKPNQRFYRVAKLATSLSRSRSSMSSISQDLTGKAKFSPAKSVDSGTKVGKARGGNSKINLSRSKSQTVESHRAYDVNHGKVGVGGTSMIRQTTVDLPVMKQQLQRQNAASGLPLARAGGTSLNSPPKDTFQPEYENKAKAPTTSHQNSTSTESPTGSVEMGHHAGNTDLESCMSITSVKINNKSPPSGDSNPSVPPLTEVNHREGQEKVHLGSIAETLGCSLSLSSMATASTCSVLGNESSSSSTVSNTTATAVSVNRPSSMSGASHASPTSDITAVSPGAASASEHCPTASSRFTDEAQGPVSPRPDHVSRTESDASESSVSNTSVTSLSEVINHSPEPSASWRNTGSAGCHADGRRPFTDGHNGVSSHVESMVKPNSGSLYLKRSVAITDSESDGVEQETDSSQNNAMSRSWHGGSASSSDQRTVSAPADRSAGSDRYVKQDDRTKSPSVGGSSAPTLASFVMDNPEPSTDARIIVTSCSGHQISQDA